MFEDWQTDWNRFIDTLQVAIDAGESSQTLSERFAGRLVQWRAIIAEPEDSDPGFIDIDFPQRILDLGNGCTAVMGPETLRIAKGTLEEWRNISVGRGVCFSAQIGPAATPFPCVEVHRLSEARGMVSTKLIDARLIKGDE